MSGARATLVLLLALAALPAAGQEPSMRLEALAERVAKLHAQIAQGVLVDRSRRALPEAMREFDAGLRAVAARPASPEVRDTYLLLGLLWQEFRGFAARPPTRDNATKLAERVEEVAWIAARGARLLHGSGRSGTGRLALEAAHAATLGQRVARLHLARRAGPDAQAAARELALSSVRLRSTLAALRAAPQNTPEIDTEIQLAEGQLAFLLQAAHEIEGGARGPRPLEFIAKSGDHIHASMERVARLYEGTAP